MLIGYARTSTTDQNAGLEAQERDLLAQGCENPLGVTDRRSRTS
jgi:DNA invertase Pin-like site-specific DNA recombinase